MNDPEKLLRGAPDDLTTKLLRSAEDDAPSTRALQRAATALGVAGLVDVTAATVVAKAGSSAALSSAGSVGSSLLVKWVGVGALSGLLIAGAAVLVESSLTPSPAPPPPQSLAPTQAVVSPTEPAARATANEPGATDPAPAPRALERSPLSATAPRPAASASAPSLADEIAALDRAKNALDRRDPASALRTLDELDRRGAAALGAEATVIRAEALLAKGDRGQARALAQRFVSEHPTSPHAARMRAILASD